MECRAEDGKVKVRGGPLPGGDFGMASSGGWTEMGLWRAWRWRKTLTVEQGARDPLPGVIARAALQKPGVIARAAVQKLAFWRR